MTGDLIITGLRYGKNLDLDYYGNTKLIILAFLLVKLVDIKLEAIRIGEPELQFLGVFMMNEC